MPQRFYKPIIHDALGKPCIIYPARDESRLDTVLSHEEPGSVEAFVDNALDANASLFEEARYLLAIAWNVDQQLYLDVWMFELENKSESGPLATAFTFKGAKRVTDMGTTSGDALILLGHEETLRRRHKTLEDYLADANRHETLPDENRADEEFYRQGGK
jgi:hypothetical protein